MPCSPPGDPPYPGMEPSSLTLPALAGGFFTTSAPWEGPVGGAAEWPPSSSLPVKAQPHPHPVLQRPLLSVRKGDAGWWSRCSPLFQADPPKSPFLGAPWLSARSEHLRHLRGPAWWDWLSCALPSLGPPPPLMPSYFISL